MAPWFTIVHTVFSRFRQAVKELNPPSHEQDAVPQPAVLGQGTVHIPLSPPNRHLPAAGDSSCSRPMIAYVPAVCQR